MDSPRNRPIEMPSRESGWGPKAEQLGQWLGRYFRRARAESMRLGELIDASRTPEGRERNLTPLITLMAASCFLLGFGFGLRRR